MYRLFLLILVFPTIINAQITEKWTDNDFSSVPIWKGSLTKFIIQPENKLLLLNAPSETSEAFISTPNSSINNAIWSFSVHMDFNPSSANYVKIFLTANQSNYDDSIEGYYIMIGGSTDEISLWKRKGEKNTKIIDGTDGTTNLSSVSVEITVERDELGNWKLQSKIGSSNPVLVGSAYDHEIISSSYFGIYCKYTSTRSKKFSFGPISVIGDPYIDKEKPKILSHELIAGNQIKLLFSEAINTNSFNKENFMVKPKNIKPEYTILNNNQINIYFKDYLPDNDLGQVYVTGIEDTTANILNDTILTYHFKRIKLKDVSIISQNSIQLTFSKKLSISDLSSINLKDKKEDISFHKPSYLNDSILSVNTSKKFKDNNTYEFIISNVKAEFGDVTKDTTVSITYRKPKRYNIIFSEIMVDPNPNIGLPNAEYIELYNRCIYPINLENWTLTINEKAFFLPNYTLDGNNYVVLTNQNEVESWNTETPIIGVKNMATLTNSSGTIVLYNSNNQVTDVLKYPFSFIEDNFKTDGGWSFERIDNSNLQMFNNWDYSACMDGGTPGIQNSIHTNIPDSIAPFVTYVSFINEHTYEFGFSETIDTLDFLNNQSIQINNAAISNLTIEPIFMDKIQIILSKNLEQNVTYKGEFMRKPTDYAGNQLFNNHSLRMGIPEEPDSFDICINELLFNPSSEGTDFVEIYNRSNKILNRSDIYLSSVTSNTPDKLIQVDDKNQLFFPDEYLVVSEDTNKLVNQSQAIIKEMLNQSHLPSLNDDEGNIAITKNTGKLMDYFEYTDDMHFELLRDKEGVSLERINPNTRTLQQNNWHSASTSSGYSTPTRKNSQFSSQITTEDDKWMWLEKEEFSPNSDGNDDFLQINYKLKEPGWSGTVIVFDRYGRQIKMLCNNELLGTENFYIWDGTTDNNTKAPIGIYLIYAKFFSGSGKIKKEKLVTVLTAGR